jgi:hypothetical protein
MFSWADGAREAALAAAGRGQGEDVCMAAVCAVARGWRDGDWATARTLARALVDVREGTGTGTLGVHVVYARVVLAEALPDGAGDALRLGPGDTSAITDAIRAAAAVQARAWGGGGGGGTRLPATCMDQALVGFAPLTRAHQTLAWGAPASDPREMLVLLWARLVARAPQVLVCATQCPALERVYLCRHAWGPLRMRHILQADATAARRTELMAVLGRAWLADEVAGLEAQAEAMNEAHGRGAAGALYLVVDADTLVHAQRLVKAVLGKARFIVVLCAGVVAALDALKKGSDVANHRARDAARMLDARLAQADPWLLMHDAPTAVACAAELARQHGPRAVVIAAGAPDQYAEPLAGTGIRALPLHAVLDAA